jgi:hypothetical protein
MFPFNREQELFKRINDLNQKYYKPADKMFKVFEEYSRGNAAILLKYFRDAHYTLVNVIYINNYISQKSLTDMLLERYVKNLKLILLYGYIALIRAKIINLLKAPLFPADLESVKLEITPEYEKLDNLNSVEYSIKDTIVKLDEVIDSLQKIDEFIENIFKKYKLYN